MINDVLWLSTLVFVLFSSSIASEVQRIHRMIASTSDSTSVANDPITLLLAPLTLQEFLQSTWQRRALVIARSSSSSSSSNRFDSWLDMFRLLDLFNRAVATSHTGAALPPVINDDFRLVKRIWLAQERQWWSAGLASLPDPAQLLDKLAAGFTFVFNRIEMRDAAVLHLCQSISAALGHRLVGCGANAYASPDGAQGFALHHDLQDAFVVQLVGQKRWSICQFWPVPLIGPWQESKPSSGDDDFGAPCETVLLNAGDTLYVPRGMLHQASTVGVDSPVSLHLTVGIATTFTMASELLHEIVRASSAGQAIDAMLHLVVRAAADVCVELRQSAHGDAALDEARSALNRLNAFLDSQTDNQALVDALKSVVLPVVGLDRFVEAEQAVPLHDDVLSLAKSWASQCNDDCLQSGVARYHASLDDKRRQMLAAANAAIQRSQSDHFHSEL